MTLRVNRTIFCCHAVLMENANNVNDSDVSSQLQLFSVVVALSAPARESVVPFGNLWMDSTTNSGGANQGMENINLNSKEFLTGSLSSNNDDHADLERYLRHVTIAEAKTNEEDLNKKNASKEGDKDAMKKKKKTAARVSSAFLAIRRVHISLSRLCRALEREEHRCKYVSLQSQDFFAIRNERQKQWDNVGNVSSGIGRAASSAAAISLETGVGSASGGGSSGGGGLLLDPSTLQSLNVTSPAIPQEQEQEQEILELILSAPPRQHPRHFGNLIGELVQVYHSLSRRDSVGNNEESNSSSNGLHHPPTPSSLLSEQDSTVYINQHLAIPMEAVGMDTAGKAASSQQATIQPYNTLLFPHSSPSELLQTFQASGSVAPQRMEQLLLTVNPQKLLTDISVDANLPLTPP
ncbi:MAG: hypothetical protein SGARI_004584 [Bacillariaceae sp.]